MHPIHSQGKRRIWHLFTHRQTFNDSMLGLSIFELNYWFTGWKHNLLIQVYLDFGLTIPKLSVHGMISSLKELLELAPINKVTI